MKYLIQEGLLPGETLLDKSYTAKELGFEGIELTIFSSPWLHERMKELMEAREKTGIQVKTLCGGYEGWIGHFDEELRIKAVNDIIKAMSYCPQIGIEGMIAPAAFGMHSNALPPFQSPRSSSKENDALVDSLKRIREAAEKHQVTFMLEPLNRYEDHMVNKVEDAIHIIRKVDSPYVKVMADLYHMNIEESNISDTLNTYFNDIYEIHLADSNRRQPGLGHTNFKEVFQTLKNNNYNGYLSFECKIDGNDKKSAIHNSLNFLKRL